MSGNELFLREDFRILWGSQNPFIAAFALQGETIRALEQRETLAFTVAGKRFFIKRHKGVSWKEILKNLLLLRLPVVSASNEYQAIGKLRELGIGVPVIAAYGKRGWWPGTRESFLVTEDVGEHQSLEDHCQDWDSNPPAFRHKLELIERLAGISRTLHQAGVCHRDYYLCHFLRSAVTGQLILIDLHRALVKPQLGQRWIIKDIAGLYFSAMGARLTRRDLYRFMRHYGNFSLREVLQHKQGFWREAEQKALRLFYKAKVNKGKRN